VGTLSGWVTFLQTASDEDVGVALKAAADEAP
jgi:hypothetical protein